MQKNYKKYLFSVFLILSCPHFTFAQQKNKSPVKAEGIVTYSFRSNGKELKEAPPLQLVFKNNIARLIQINHKQKSEGQYFDFNQQIAYQILTQKNGEKVTLKTPFSTYEKPTITGDTTTILGYACKKAKVIIRSNTIEIWFTDKLPVKGSPSLGIAPGLGLILKTIRNGNFETYATKIELRNVEDSIVDLPKDLGEVVDEATYHRKEIDNRFTTFPVFSHQQINFTDSIVNPEDDKENVTYRYAGGTLVLKKIKLPEADG